MTHAQTCTVVALLRRRNLPSLCVSFWFFLKLSEGHPSIASIIPQLQSFHSFNHSIASNIPYYSKSSIRLYVSSPLQLPHDPNNQTIAQVSSPLTLSHDPNNQTIMDAIWPIIANKEVLAVSQSYAISISISICISIYRYTYRYRYRYGVRLRDREHFLIGNDRPDRIHDGLVVRVV